jgi:hypothetical protein
MSSANEFEMNSNSNSNSNPSLQERFVYVSTEIYNDRCSGYMTVEMNERFNDILELIETNQVEELKTYVKRKRDIQLFARVISFLNSYVESYYLFEQCSIEMMDLLYGWKWLRLNSVSRRAFELFITRSVRNRTTQLNSKSAFPMLWWLVDHCKTQDYGTFEYSGMIRTIMMKCTLYDVDMCLKYNI